MIGDKAVLVRLTEKQLWLILNQLEASSEPAHRAKEEDEMLQILNAAWKRARK